MSGEAPAPAANVEWAAIEYAQSFSKLTARPATSRSSCGIVVPRSAPCRAPKHSSAIGDSAIVAARFGTKPMRSRIALRAGAVSSVWMVNMAGTMPPRGQRRHSLGGNGARP